MKHKIILTCFLAVCTFVYAQEKTIDKTFSNVTNIRLTTASGSITLKKGSGSDVKVLLKYTYDDSQYKPVFEQSANRLRIKEEFSRDNNSGSANWTLEVPDKMDIDINTGSGDITVDGLTLEIKSNTGSGDIMLSSVKGELDFNTGSGDIGIERADGDIHLNTGSGDVRASNGTGAYSINAGSGTIRLEQLRGDLSANTGSGNIRATEITLTGSSSFNSGSGNTSVSLAAPLEHNISVNSGSGDSKLAFNGNAINGQVVMTANKSNGNIVAPFKFDKEETIDDNNSNARIRKTAKLGNKDITIKIGTGSGTAEIVK